MSTPRYREIFQRNLGFVTPGEQEKLKSSSVFICGVGGMGGAALQSLVRAGVGRLVIADIDRFEATNLNRQVFCYLGDVGKDKCEVTARRALEINPSLKIEIHDGSWEKKSTLGKILRSVDAVINGTDDLPPSIQLFRACAKHGKTVIDAWPCPLPSVFVTRPGDPRPEQWMGFKTVGLEPWEWTDEILLDARLRQAAFLMGQSSSAKWIDPGVIQKALHKEIPLPTFAPMVHTGGNLMTYHAIQILLGRKHGTDYRGYFFNPYTGRVERPAPRPIERIQTRFIRGRIEHRIQKWTHSP